MVKLNIPAKIGSLSVDETLKALKTSVSKGLNDAEVEGRLQEYGRNELPEIPPTPMWKLILAQFEDGLVRILLCAAAVSFVMALTEEGYGGFVEPVVILLILIANATVGVVQEARASEAIDALKSFVPKIAHGLRNGKMTSVPAESLVPGDIIEVSVGDRVPADCRICEVISTTLRADQAILNGESVEAIKHADSLSAKETQSETFSSNCIFSGTAIVYGKARCVVVKTGSETEIGNIERGVREQEETKTPLQIKLDDFGDQLSKWIGYICLAVLLIHITRWYFSERDPNGTFWENYGHPWVECMKIAVALAVAAIPEGLPAVVTTCLALGTRRMAKHNALVRELPSVETLGRCTVICSDKTGTLTTNTMSVKRVFTLGGSTSHDAIIRYDFKETQYAPDLGCVSRRGGQALAPGVCDENEALKTLAIAATLCNEAFLTKKGNIVEKQGESTEAALKTMSEKLLSTDASDIRNAHDKVVSQWTRKATLEFTRQRKSMGVYVVPTKDKGTGRLFVKGAPEAVLGRCKTYMKTNGTSVPLTAEMRKIIMEEVSAMAGNVQSALRCLAVAYKEVTLSGLKGIDDPGNFEQVESDLILTGIVGMLDPPRLEVADAIADCNTAGIRVVVITGDNKDTAEAISRHVGVIPADATPEEVATMSFTGQDLDKMTQKQKIQMIHTARLFSRTNPTHKLQLVDLLQKQGLICAMTGDGVNDAPALKKADIGIAMGTGTEVAKAASKMVLADDDFASVVHAVKEGRAIYNNTKQFIRYLISSNIGEVFCVLTTGILGIPEALIPVQLLWVNLVTDGLPATALGFNPADPDIMQQPPRALDEPIVNGWLFFRYVVIGAYVGLATVGGFVWSFLMQGITVSQLMQPNVECLSHADPGFCKATIASPLTGRAIALSILVVIEMFNAVNSLSENQSILATRPTQNPWLLLAIASSMLLHFLIMYVPFFCNIFSIVPLGWEEWKVVLVFSFPVILVDEVLKYIARVLQQSPNAPKKKHE